MSIVFSQIERSFGMEGTHRLYSGQFLGSNLKIFEASGLTVSETIYVSKVSEEWHSHENALLCMALYGGNKESRKGRDLQVITGTTLFYRAGEVHRNTHTALPSRNINVEMAPHWLTAFDLKEDSVAEALSRVSARLQLVRIYKELLNAEINMPAIEILLLQLLAVDRPAGTVRPSWVNMLREYLHDQWNDPLSLRVLANQTGVHPVTISRYFARYFGCTFGEYHRRLKIEKSVTMLGSQMPLTEIAFRCGFADQSHFIRQFKLHTGYLPSTYRKLIRR